MTAAVGCTDLATPAELSHPQILGIRAEPPLIAPGDSATLSALIAGPDGAIDAVATWTVVAAPGQPPLGHVETTAGAAVYVAPETVPATDSGIAIAEVELSTTVDGYDMVAQKLIGIGAGAHPNPTLTEISINGTAASGTEIVVPIGATVPLSATTDPAVGESGQIAWYATAGEIEIYRGADTEMVAPAKAASAVLFVVARDGLGGIDWREIHVRFQ